MSRRRKGSCVRTWARRGFTLAEAAVTVGVSSIILVGMGAALAMSVTAVDRGDDASARASERARVAAMIGDDAAVATAIATPDAATLVFTVPDRTGDALTDTITYAYDPATLTLRRGLNAQTPVRIADRLTGISYTPSVRTATLAAGNEVVLASFVDVAGASSNTKEAPGGTALAQVVHPDLPREAKSWGITRVQLRLQGVGTPGGSFTVSIMRTDNSWRPSGVPLWQATMAESSLPTTADWRTYTVSGVDGLDLNEAIAIVVESASSDSAVAVEFEHGSGLPKNTAMVQQNSGSWQTPSGDEDIKFFLYGRINTERD
jgi:hypothetical protein